MINQIISWCPSNQSNIFDIHFIAFTFNQFTFDLLLSSLNPGSFDFVTNDNPVIAQQGEVLDLGQTANWVVSSSRANISVPANVPGGVYSDLRQVKDGE